MKTVLITGGSGFLGRHLALALKDRYRVILGARNNGANHLAETLTGCPAVPLDVASAASVRDVFLAHRPHYVVHAAATKFVDRSERYPYECIDINVTGSEHVARLSQELGVERVIGVSTDKAAPPVGNLYGHSKAVMERLFCALDGTTPTRFACVRFGNIAWSTGSIFGIWKHMLATQGVIQSTGPRMRRFFFSVQEAAALVATALEEIDTTGGRILSRKMKVAQISDLLDTWTRHHGGRWIEIAPRPGDKDDEFLIGELEAPVASEIALAGRPHYLIAFNTRSPRPLPGPVSSATAPRLTADEMLALITGEPVR